jgi:hypothetical protein
MKQASPWDALLKVPPQRISQPVPKEDGGAKPPTRTAELLAVLGQREDATTLQLAVCTDLTPRQVWGLLKQPRAIGQVRFEGDRWSLVREFAGRDVERAAALLRARGWRVEPPGGIR